jgi:hypothetical protein
MNARQEFVFHTAGKKIKCAILTFDDGSGYWNEDDGHTSNAATYGLPVGYTQEEHDVFTQSIDREYDAGYGGQQLFGTIWYQDGTWSSRGEYDGSEWWDWHKCPVIPAVLNPK